jgi:hypothetical protein
MRFSMPLAPTCYAEVRIRRKPTARRTGGQATGITTLSVDDAAGFIGTRRAARIGKSASALDHGPPQNLQRQDTRYASYPPSRGDRWGAA